MKDAGVEIMSNAYRCLSQQLLRQPKLDTAALKDTSWPMLVENYIPPTAETLLGLGILT